MQTAVNDKYAGVFFTQYEVVLVFILITKLFRLLVLMGFL